MGSPRAAPRKRSPSPREAGPSLWSNPRAPWQTRESDDSTAGEASFAAAALLVPAGQSGEAGDKPPCRWAVGPALKRGAGPKQVPSDYLASSWPHEIGPSLSEVPILYPNTIRRRRILVAAPAASTATDGEDMARVGCLASTAPLDGFQHRLEKLAAQQPTASSSKTRSPSSRRRAGKDDDHDYDSASNAAGGLSTSSAAGRGGGGGPLLFDPAAEVELDHGVGWIGRDDIDFAQATMTTTGGLSRTTVCLGVSPKGAPQRSSSPLRGQGVISHFNKNPLGMSAKALLSEPQGRLWVETIVAKPPIKFVRRVASEGALPRRRSPAKPRKSVAPLEIPGKLIEGRERAHRLQKSLFDLRRTGKDKPRANSITNVAARFSCPGTDHIIPGRAATPGSKSWANATFSDLELSGASDNEGSPADGRSRAQSAGDSFQRREDAERAARRQQEQLRRRATYGAVPVPTQEIQGSIIEVTLSDVTDTAALLEEKIRAHEELASQIEDTGGKCHPTAIMGVRGLLLLKRKKVLLTTLEEAVAAFEKTNADRDQIIEAIVNGVPAAELLAGGMALTDTIAEVRNKKGEPQDLDRSVFETMASIFGLPTKHCTILRAKRLMHDECITWGYTGIERIKLELEKERSEGSTNPHSPAALLAEAIADLADACDSDLDSSPFKEIIRLGKAARSQAVKRGAEQELVLDKARAQARDSGDRAKDAAERVEGFIKIAIALGVEKAHPDLREASRLAAELRAESLRRFCIGRVEARKRKDAPGEAEKAADEIEDFIRSVIKVGCPVDHPEVDAARKVAVAERGFEKDRKRAANRAKAQSAKPAQA